MRNTVKQNRGITLIALVITIIVLLILAGVAMLSGENGILKKAADAKTETEQAKQDEEITLMDYEIDGYFIEKGSKYKCRYGMITGVSLNGNEVKDKVSDLKSALPSSECKIFSEDEKTELSDTDKLKTGVAIKKGDKTIARVVVFGDTDCNGTINIMDADVIGNIVATGKTEKQYVAMAADANHNGIIDYESGSNYDQGKITQTSKDQDTIDQNFYVTDLEKLLSETNPVIEKKYAEIYQEKLKGSAYSIEWDTNDKVYVLKGVNSTTTVEDILKAFGNDENIKVFKSDNTERTTGTIDSSGSDSVRYIKSSERSIVICWTDIF